MNFTEFVFDEFTKFVFDIAQINGFHQICLMDLPNLYFIDFTKFQWLTFAFAFDSIVVRFALFVFLSILYLYIFNYTII
jgi:hypothetical protein